MNKGKKRIVVALGGNALGNTPEEQIRQVRFAAEIIADLAAEGHELIIGHGNGPQVGIINSAMNYAAVSGPKTPYMPFPECGAMSQGFIGYHLSKALLTIKDNHTKQEYKVQIDSENHFKEIKKNDSYAKKQLKSLITFMQKISIKFDNKKVFELDRIERYVKLKNYVNH